MNRIEKISLIKTRWDKIQDGYWACYRAIADVIAPVWYRYFGYKHHVIKTSLTPSAWHDADERILYGVMECVKWFVENDMRAWSKEDLNKEIERIEEESNGKEYQDREIAFLKEQYEIEMKITSIADWWKNYDNRLEEIEKTRSEWHDYINDFKVKDERYCFPSKLRNRMTEEEKKREDSVFEKGTEMEEKLLKEEQEMLKLAIEVRNSMWS